MTKRLCIPVEDPILNARPSILSLVLGFVPNILDLSQQTLLSRGSGILGLNALLGYV